MNKENSIQVQIKLNIQGCNKKWSDKQNYCILRPNQDENVTIWTLSICRSANAFFTSSNEQCAPFWSDCDPENVRSSILISNKYHTKILKNSSLNDKHFQNYKGKPENNPPTDAPDVARKESVRGPVFALNIFVLTLGLSSQDT